MAKKSDPKTTYSFRLQPQTVTTLQQRASEQRTTVGALIRSLIFDYLDQRETEDVLAQMEARIIATINRIHRQQARTRWGADLTLATVDYIRRFMDSRYLTRLDPNEATSDVIRRGDKAFSDWVQKSLDHRLGALLNMATTEHPASLDDQADSEALAEAAEPGGR